MSCELCRYSGNISLMSKISPVEAGGVGIGERHHYHSAEAYSTQSSLARQLP